MKKDEKAKLTQAAACLLSAVLVWRYGFDLEGSEFSGGWLTGPLLNMEDVGSLLFILALLLTFFYRRIAAATTLIACLLCFPLYLYFTAPGLFRWIFSRAEWSVPLHASFVWNKRSILGIVVMAIAAFVSVRNLLTPASSKSQSSP